MAKRKTAGELSLKASSDNTVYDPLEVGYAVCDDVINQLHICGLRHASLFDEDQYFLMLIIAGDPLIHGVKRHKYAAFIHMPSPRPEQSVYLYTKSTQKIKRLWSLPNAKIMAIISETPYVDKKWQMTKKWCDSFFNKTFWEDIRHQYGITHLSEHEYLNAHREELIKAGCKESETLIPQPFDFSKITIDQIIDTKTAIAN